MAWIRSLLLARGLLVMSLSACQPLHQKGSETSAVNAASDPDQLSKPAWLDKTARTLLYGSGGMSEEMETLLELPEAEIVEALMRDPRFFDTILDFNLFFFQEKNERLVPVKKSLKTAEYGSRAALASAHQLAKNGDYFQLFDWEVPIFQSEELGGPTEAGVDEASKVENFTQQVWKEIYNSYTNFNRRRAAFVLRTYFCDDLTPVNVSAPAEHSSDRHASDPACMACHYKLDPMAGFFRYRGFGGVSYENNPSYIHDDLSIREGGAYQEYLSTWRAAPESGREWEVGYIRAPGKEDLNRYGSSLPDLFQIIREAKEPKVCLVRRAAEYVLGIGQAYDGGWIQSMANPLIEAGKANKPVSASSDAIKSVFKSLVLSKTFRAKDPVGGECYDFAPGEPRSKLPCSVSYIIEKNCVNCHSAEGASGGLDLGSWKQQADGSGSFGHYNEKEQRKIPPKETFERMSARLSSGDPSFRMPYKKEMNAVERATLFKWVQEQVAAAQADAGAEPLEAGAAPAKEGPE